MRSWKSYRRESRGESRKEELYQTPRSTLGVGLELAFFAASCRTQTSSERAVIDARAPGCPFPHLWEQTFESGEVGVYIEDNTGNAVHNFSYVDQIYDRLLQNGVRPLVVISFMPKKLALCQDVHPFRYKQIVAPPKDYQNGTISSAPLRSTSSIATVSMRWPNGT
jgi:hypothetical protein